DGRGRELGQAADRGGDHRGAGGHRLEGDQRHALGAPALDPDRRERDHVALREQAIARGAAHLAGELDAAGRRGGGEAPERRLVRTGAGEDQPGVAAPEARGGGEDGGALDGDQPSEEEDGRPGGARGGGAGGREAGHVDAPRADLGGGPEARAQRPRRRGEKTRAEILGDEREAHAGPGEERGGRREGAGAGQGGDVAGVGDGQERQARRGG